MRLLRNSVVALTSAAVVAFLVAYALTSASFTLETAVSAVEEHAGSQALVRGRVLEADGDAIPNAQIRIHRPGGATRVTRSSERGSFRIDLRGSCAASRIDLLVTGRGGPVRTTVNRHLCPGQALEIDARLVTAGQLIWVPTS